MHYSFLASNLPGKWKFPVLTDYDHSPHRVHFTKYRPQSQLQLPLLKNVVIGFKLSPHAALWHLKFLEPFVAPAIRAIPIHVHTQLFPLTHKYPMQI